MRQNAKISFALSKELQRKIEDKATAERRSRSDFIRLELEKVCGVA